MDECGRALRQSHDCSEGRQLGRTVGRCVGRASRAVEVGSPEQVAYTPDGDSVIACGARESLGRTTICRIEATSGKVLAEVAAPDAEIHVCGDGVWYGAAGKANRLDAKTLATTDTIDVGASDLWAVAVHGAQGQAPAARYEGCGRRRVDTRSVRPGRRADRIDGQGMRHVGAPGRSPDRPERRRVAGRPARVRRHGAHRPGVERRRRGGAAPVVAAGREVRDTSQVRASHVPADVAIDPSGAPMPARRRHGVLGRSRSVRRS